MDIETGEFVVNGWRGREIHCESFIPGLIAKDGDVPTTEAVADAVLEEQALGFVFLRVEDILQRKV